MLFVCGIPLLLMELTVGQFTRRGPVGALAKLCPLLKGNCWACITVYTACYKKCIRLIRLIAIGIFMSTSEANTLLHIFVTPKRF